MTAPGRRAGALAGLPLAFPGMRIGLLGGSFGPAHAAHAHITAMALRRFQLDRVWWLVSPGNPLKAHGPAPIAQRIANAQALLSDPRVIVTDIECRLGTRMTADTVAALQGRWPGVRFVWLMGSDNMVQFAHWDRWREIAARVPIGVIARPGSRMQARFSRAATALSRYRLPEAMAGQLALCAPPVWTLINVPMMPQSSSEIRARMQAEPPAPGPAACQTTAAFGS